MKQKHLKANNYDKDHGKNLFDVIVFLLLFLALLWYLKI
jgi:cytochrome c1